jgi:hypothetical protein
MAFPELLEPEATGLAPEEQETCQNRAMPQAAGVKGDFRHGCAPDVRKCTIPDQ